VDHWERRKTGPGEEDLTAAIAPLPSSAPLERILVGTLERT
jgi:hypothetical protein